MSSGRRTGSQDVISGIGVARAKLVLLGDTEVGKSTLVLRFQSDKFSQPAPTIGAAYNSAQIRADNGVDVKLEIWDTAGQEHYASLAPLYFRSSACVILVYDVSKPESLAKARFWYDQVRENGVEDAIYILVGNKIDLAAAIPEADAREFAEAHGCVFFQSSAKTGEGVEQVFKYAANQIAKRWVASGAPTDPPAKGRVTLDDDDAASGRRCCTII